MHGRSFVALALALLALVLAGCGGGGDGASSADAVVEIGEVRALLGQGLDAYESGDAEAADRLVGDAYLEHFEEVEAPLEERDAELMEELETLISTTIRDRIKSGAPVSEVKTLVDEANSKLSEAEALLQSE